MGYIIGKEELTAIQQVLNNGNFDRYIDGENSITNRFEKSFSKKIGTSYSLAVSSGTAALICGLAGMKIGPGDEVIIPSYTYIATALAVLAVGATPVIAEIDESLTIDPENIISKITPATKAIIPVHMRGLPCNMAAIMNIAQYRNILVLEDVAQACGGSYQGTRLGAFGDAGMFSFNHYKIITCGEGGALVTNNLEIYQRATIQHHGGCIYEIDTPEFQVQTFAGWNFRLSEIASAMLSAQLTRLDDILAALRSEKKFILEKMKLNFPTLMASPINDIRGDCGTNVFFLMESADQAKEFIRKSRDVNMEIYLAHTKGHVYSEWEPILQRRGAHHPLRNALQHNQNLYSSNMCPKSLDILGRTVGIATRVDRDQETLDNITDDLIVAVKGVV